MPAKTPRLFCAVDSMPKLVLDVTGGERWVVSGPQRAITCKEAFHYSTFEGTHLEGGPVFAEAGRARSARSPTVRSGPVDAQPPLLFSANRSGRQRISAELQKHFEEKRQRTLASMTAQRVCTKEEGEKDRRKVHEVAEQHDEPGVERRWPFPV